MLPFCNPRIINICLACIIYNFKFHIKINNTKFDKIVVGRCSHSPIIQYRRSLFFIHINIFRHLKLEIGKQFQPFPMLHRDAHHIGWTMSPYHFYTFMHIHFTIMYPYMYTWTHTYICIYNLSYICTFAHMYTCRCTFYRYRYISMCTFKSPDVHL